VQVRNTVAETIINSLNGNMFRGRPLTVNFARSKKDAESASLDGEDRQDDSSETWDEGRPDYENDSDSGDTAFLKYDSDDPVPDTEDFSSTEVLSDEDENGDAKGV
jgi:hypothetical protein